MTKFKLFQFCRTRVKRQKWEVSILYANEHILYRCETIFWPPPPYIYWPRGQYIVRYFDPGVNISWRYFNPLTIFWPPSQQYTKQFCWLWPIVKCGVLLSLHNIYEFWEDGLGVKQVYQNNMRWWLVSCFHLQLVKPFITLWNHVLVVQNESIINTQGIINMTVTRQIWGIWKLRPAYSSETPNLGQNRWCFVPCDLEIWWMTLENNRASSLLFQAFCNIS